MAVLRSLLVASAVAGAAAFSPASVVPRAANGVTGLCMSAGGGKPKVVAAFRGAPPGKAGLPPQGSDPSSINLDLVNGVPNPNDTVGGIDTTYSKPPSTFFSGAAARPAPKAAARPAPKAAAKPKPAARAATKPAARTGSVRAARPAPVAKRGPNPLRGTMRIGK